MKKGFKFILVMAVLTVLVGVVACSSKSKKLNLSIDNVTKCELISGSTGDIYVISNDEAMQIIDMLNDLEVKTDSEKRTGWIYRVIMYDGEETVLDATISSKSVRIRDVGNYTIPDNKGEKIGEYMDSLGQKYFKKDNNI